MLSHAGTAGVQCWCPSCWDLPDPLQTSHFTTPRQPGVGDSWAAVTFLALSKTAHSASQEQRLRKRCLQTQEVEACHRAGTAGKPGHDAMVWQLLAVLQSSLHGSASCAFHILRFEECPAQTQWKGNIFLAKKLQEQVLDILLAIKIENTVGRHLRWSLYSSSCFYAASRLRSTITI